MSEEIEDFLSPLILWRNDPAHAERVRVQAEAGNPHAQYAMGLIYAEGRGVACDFTEAYLWLSRAAAQGDADAVTLRYSVQNQLTLEEIAAADARLAAETGAGR